MLRKKGGVNASYDRCNIGADLLAAPGHVECFHRVGGEKGRYGNQIRPLRLDGVFDLRGVRAEAVISLEEREGCIYIVPVVTLQVRKRTVGDGSWFLVRPQIEELHVGTFPHCGTQVEQGEGIGSDGRVVVVFYRGLNKEYLHDESITDSYGHRNRLRLHDKPPDIEPSVIAGKRRLRQSTKRRFFLDLGRFLCYCSRYAKRANKKNIQPVLPVL